MERWQKVMRAAGVAWLLLAVLTFTSGSPSERVYVLTHAVVGIAMIVWTTRGVAYAGSLAAFLQLLRTMGDVAAINNTPLMVTLLVAGGLSFAASTMSRPVPPKEPPPDLI